MQAMMNAALRRSRRPTRTPKRDGVRAAEVPAVFARHIFICGLHRSGTTLLENWLRAKTEVAVLRANVPENEGQHLQDVYPAAKSHGGPGRFAYAPEMHPAAPAPEAAARLRDRLLACWTTWVQGDADALLEKSPPNLTKIPFLRALFPGAAFVIVVRDPRAVAAATQKWSHTSFEELVFHWHVAHESAWRTMGPDCVPVRYEDFCADPEGETETILAALDLPRRAPPRRPDPRFEALSNTNERYMEPLPARILGSGIWDRFGYALG